MTRRLHLLRHAKSSWDDPELPDHDRPLAPRGRRACAAIAAHLQAEAIVPALVLCSSATRARETLRRISPGFDDAGDVRVEVEDDLYGASADELLARIRGVHGDLGSVMLIGHQPAIQGLATSLAGSGDDLERLHKKFPTAALASLAVPGPWAELGPGSAELVAFVKPRELEK